MTGSAVKTKRILGRLFDLTFGLIRLFLFLNSRGGAEVTVLKLGLSRYHPGWGKPGGHRTYCLLSVPQALLLVDDFEKGIVQVTRTPHFAAAEQILDSKSESYAVSEWAAYIQRQHGFSRHRLAEKEAAFRTIVELAGKSYCGFEIFVRWDKRRKAFIVLDGFHRFAAMAAAGENCLIRCYFTL